MKETLTIGIPDVLQKFGEYLPERTYLVGGYVRDALLGMSSQSKDIDLEVFGTEAAMLEVKLKQLCVAHGSAKVDYVGKSFGVYKLHIDDMDIDVALARKEVSTGDAHTDFDVEVAPSITMEEAALRRDFTINALYANIKTGQIIDPTLRGVSDLTENKRLDPCSEAFKEDPLRVLRAMQFIARFSLGATDELIQYSNDCVGMFEDLPKERIWQEFVKLFTKGFKPSSGFLFLEQAGWSRFFEGVSALANRENEILYCDLLGSQAYWHAQQPLDALVSMLGCVANDLHEENSFELFLNNICTTKRVISCATAVGQYDIMRFMEAVRQNPITVLRQMSLNLFPATIAQLELMLSSTLALTAFLGVLAGNEAGVVQSMKKFKFVTGEDMLAWGVPQGPMMSEVEALLQELWLKNQLYTNSKVHAKAIVEEYLKEKNHE